MRILSRVGPQHMRMSGVAWTEVTATQGRGGGTTAFSDMWRTRSTAKHLGSRQHKTGNNGRPWKEGSSSQSCEDACPQSRQRVVFSRVPKAHVRDSCTHTRKPPASRGPRIEQVPPVPRRILWERGFVEENREGDVAHDGRPGSASFEQRTPPAMKAAVGRRHSTTCRG